MANQMAEKIYVFVTPFITMLGGSQLYILRKMKWLESIGWRVVVLSTVDGKVMIPEFDQFRSHVYPVLSIPAYCVPKWRRDSICEKILAKIGNAKEWFFQSHDEPCATWAEVLAEKVGGTHFCHLLAETFLPHDEMMLDFLRFKRLQKLLRGISDKSIPLLLPNEKESEGLGLSAVGCSYGNVSDCSCEELNGLGRADYTILVFGRLAKPTVGRSLKAVAQFATTVPLKKINLIVLGDSAIRSIVKNLQHQMSRIGNVRTIWLGNRFPIPRKLFSISDVCLASAGCATVAYREKCPCISIDSEDEMAIGIMGITTRNSLFRDDEPQLPPESLLKEILTEHKYDRTDMQLSDCQKLDYTLHAKILAQSNQQDYFLFHKYKMSIKDRVIASLVGLGSGHIYLSLMWIRNLMCGALVGTRGLLK